MLPPLTFYEFLVFLAEDELLIDVSYTDSGGYKYPTYNTKKIDRLNELSSPISTLVATLKQF